MPLIYKESFSIFIMSTVESKYMQTPGNVQDWSSLSMSRIPGICFGIGTEVPYVVPNYSELK